MGNLKKMWNNFKSNYHAHFSRNSKKFWIKFLTHFTDLKQNLKATVKKLTGKFWRNFKGIERNSDNNLEWLKENLKKFKETLEKDRITFKNLKKNFKNF